MTGLHLKYFVLKPEGGFDAPYAKASRAALKVYADLIEDENHQLCYDIHQWVIVEQGKANEQHLLAKLETAE